MTTDTYSIQVQVDSTSAVTATRNLTAMEQATGRSERALSSLGNVAKIAGSALAGISIASLAKDILKVNMEFESLRTSLETVTGSAKNAKIAFEGIQQFAAKTPYSVKEVTEAFIKMQVKGETKKEEKLGNFDYSKYIDFGLKYTSLLRIGLNPFNAITNILVGNIGNIIESVGGRHFTYKQYVKAREIFFKELGGDSKTNKLIEIFNPLMELEDYENLNKINVGSSEYKEKIKSIMYSPQRLGEKYLQTSTMIASLLHDKVTTKDGKSISMWEAFNDKGEWNETLMGVPLTEDMIFRTTNKVQRINQMIHGRYSAKDAAALSQYSLFRMAFQFKKWIPAAIESRLQGKRFDDRLGVDTEGRYHTYVKFLQLSIAKLTKDVEKIKSNQFNETDIYNMRKNMMELAIVLSSSLMYIGLGWDDDDKKKGWYKFTMNQLDKVSGDMLFFYNPAEINRNLTTGLPMLKTTSDMIKALKSTIYIFGGEKSEYTKGKFAGENKAVDKLSAGIGEIVIC